MSDWNVASGALAWDDAMHRIYGTTPETGIDYATWREAVLPEDIERVEATLQSAIEHRAAASTEFRIRHRRWGIRYLETAYAVAFDEADRATHVVGVSLDVTEHWQASERLIEANQQLASRIAEISDLMRQLAELAVRDGLTGLYNRRHFDEFLSRELDRAAREGYGVSLVMADLDGFKSINDHHGHQVGDMALKTWAELMRLHMRSSDILCRFGGDEFAMVLPHTSKEAAAERAEELRALLAARPFPVDGSGTLLRVTVSQGVTYAEPGQMTPEQFIRQADEALFRAKEQGRNCVVTQVPGGVAGQPRSDWQECRRQLDACKHDHNGHDRSDGGSQ